MTMRIVADLTDSKLISQKNAEGLLYLEEGKTEFPDKYWTDFVITVLGWWIEEFLKQMKKFK